MKKLNPNSATGTFAEFVMLTAQHRTEAAKVYKENLTKSNYGTNTKAYQQIASALPKVKRLSYDRSFLRLVQSTEAMETADIIGQMLSRSTFPFDHLWIEGPNPLLNQSPYEKDYCIGVLVSADQATNSFTFKYVLEKPDDPAHAYNRFGGRVLQYIKDGRVLDTHAAATRVSENGIRLDDEALLTRMQEVAELYGKDNDAVSMVDQAYGIADFLARVFVVLSSENLIEPGQTEKSSADIAAERVNQTRKGMGWPPLLHASPINILPSIRIDLAQGKYDNLKTEKQVRQLLGWTSVRRSKLITRPDGTLWLRKRDGKPWSRKDHDRRIEKDMDRRNAQREILASKPLVIENKNGRPARVRNDQCSDIKKEC